MNNIIVRKYKDSDYEAMYELHVKAMVEVGAYFGEGPWDNDLKEIKGHYFDNRGSFLVAEADGKLVAMGAFRNLGDGRAEIKRMRTTPAWQGRGLGTMILKKLLEKAAEAGYREAILETSEKQKAARRLYNSFGFVEYKQEIIQGAKCGWFKKEL